MSYEDDEGYYYDEEMFAESKRAALPRVSNLEQVANELIAEAQITGKNMYWANRFTVALQREKTAKAITNFGETIAKLKPIQPRQNG